MGSYEGSHTTGDEIRFLHGLGTYAVSRDAVELTPEEARERRLRLLKSYLWMMDKRRWSEGIDVEKVRAAARRMVAELEGRIQPSEMDKMAEGIV